MVSRCCAMRRSVGGAVAHFGAREQADVREPRLTAEGRRVEIRRHHRAAGRADGLVERGCRTGPSASAKAGRSQLTLPYDSTNSSSTSAPCTRANVESITGAGPSARTPAPLISKAYCRACLAHTMVTGVAMPGHCGTCSVSSRCTPPTATASAPSARTPRRTRRIGGAVDDRGECPAQRQVEDRRHEDQRRQDGHDDPRRRYRREHGADGRQMRHVPVEIDGAAPHRLRGDVRVAANRERHPDPGQHAGHAHPARRDHAVQQHEQGSHAEYLERQIAAQAHERRRPDVDEGERGVQERQRERDAGPMGRGTGSSHVSERSEYRQSRRPRAAAQ